MKHTYLLKALFVIIVIFSIPIIVLKSRNINVYSDEYKTVKILEEDTTGDSVKEKIKILADEQNKGYLVEITHDNNKIYRLEPSSKFKFLATYTPFYNLNMIITDINNDSVPEIITWGDLTHENEIHIFKWNGIEYEIIFSGFYDGFKFKDIDGDNMLELVIRNRIYGVGYEYIYYSWKNNTYKKIYFEFDSARGYDKIVTLLEVINSLPPNKNVFFSTKNLDYYFTKEWIQREENLQKLEEFNTDLLSIQITDYLENYDVSNKENLKGITVWPFKVKIFRNKNGKVQEEDLIMEVRMKYVKTELNGNWKINSIDFIKN